MRLFSCLISSFLASLFITGCMNPSPSSHRLSTNFIEQQSVKRITKERYVAKNPNNIKFYDQLPKTPYRVIGITKVSKHTLLGAKRNSSALQEMMKKMAASIGGEAIINVQENEHIMQGHIVTFPRILL